MSNEKPERRKRLKRYDGKTIGISLSVDMEKELDRAEQTTGIPRADIVRQILMKELLSWEQEHRERGKPPSNIE